MNLSESNWAEWNKESQRASRKRQRRREEGRGSEVAKYKRYKERQAVDRTRMTRATAIPRAFQNHNLSLIGPTTSGLAPSMPNKGSLMPIHRFVSSDGEDAIGCYTSIEIADLRKMQCSSTWLPGSHGQPRRPPTERVKRTIAQKESGRESCKVVERPYT